MPILFGIFVTFCLWFAYESSKHSRASQKRYQEMLKREYDAQMARKKDISSLPKISIPKNLPMNDTNDAYLNSIYNDIHKLETKDIINFTGYTNTDLKLMYGASNLSYLSECDNNFTKLAITLNKWANYLYKHDNVHDCKTILEYAVSINIDITNIYILLANIYISENKAHKINSLIKKASKLNSSISTSIVDKLNVLKEI
ncbi:MAG: hypothetical protein E7262_02105 [Lachnospiraceae bacterium]|nr:hypothetical protein [Lachnospiraceae bacterium]